MELMEMKTDAVANYSKRTSKLDARLQLARNNLTANTRVAPEKEYHKTSSQIEHSINGIEPNFEKIIDFLDSNLVYANLDRILSFLQSDKNEMCFPNLSRFLELFVINIVKDVNILSCKKFDDKCKKVCEEIIRVVLDNSHIYKWDCRQERRYDKEVLVFSKVYITPSRTNQFRAPRTISTRKSQNMLTLNTENLQEALNNNHPELPTSFKIQWLNNTLKFIKDETQLILEYPKMTSQQVKFVMSLIDQQHVDNDVGFGYKSLYAPLREAMKIYSLKYYFGVGINAKKSDVSCLLLEKIPKTSVKDPIDNIQPENNQLDTQTIPPQNDKIIGLPEAITETALKESVSENTPTISSQNRANITEKSKMPNAPTKLPLNKRKTLLLEAMSVPVNSDIALRIMTNMGWEGGALGRTGEGIIEPLIPVLDRMPGAGLGLVITEPPKKTKMSSPRKGKNNNNNRVRVCFRSELFQHILNLVTSEVTTKEIQYTVPLCKKEKSFVKHVSKSINSRSVLGLEGDDKVIYMKLLEELCRYTDLQINVNISDNSMRIKLTKIFGKTGTTSLLCKWKHGRKIETDKSSNRTPLNNSEKILITSSVINYNAALMLPYCQSYMTNKSLLSQTFRIIIFVQILEFIKSKALTREVSFEGELSAKQCMFIEDAVVRVNRKERGGSTKLEANILTDIRECDVQFCLNVKIPGSLGSKKMVFILEKKYIENLPLSTTNQGSNVTSNNMLNNESRKINKSPNKISQNDAHNSDKMNIAVTINNTNRKINGNNKLVNGNLNKEDGKITEKCTSTLLSDKESPNDIDSINNVHSNKRTSNVVDPDELEYNSDDLENYLSDEDHMQMDKDINDEELIIKKLFSQTNNKNKQLKFDSDEEMYEKTEVFINKYVYLVPKKYPEEITDAVYAKKIQSLISKCLDESNVMPLLKCHGVKDGALVYSCHTEKSYSWLESMCVASDIKVINSKEFHDTVGYKMSIRVNTFIDECYTRLFNRLELYNEGLRTGKWRLMKKKKYSGFIVVIVRIDEKSFNYVKAAGFSLFAGVDEAKFSIIWD